MRKARLICIPLLAVFAIQATDLNRWTYLYFQLAPRCPVLGASTATGSHCQSTSAQAIHTDAPCAATAPNPEPAEPPPTPFAPEDCPTCHMFATARQVIDVQPDAPLCLDLSERIQRPANTGLPWGDSTQPRRARAPPII